MSHLHEASSNKVTFKDIMDIAIDGIDSGIGSKPAEGYSYSYTSIAKAASKLIAVFPVLSSRTISAETAKMVTKYVEQKACFLFTIALQQANISNAKDGIEYLSRYHKNLDDGMSNVVTSMKSWVDSKLYESSEESFSSALIKESIDEDSSYIFDYLLESDTDLVISAKDLNELMDLMESNSRFEFFDNNLNPISINDYKVNESYDGQTYHVSMKPGILTEAKKKPGPSYADLEEEIKRLEAERDKYKKDKEAAEARMGSEKAKYEEAKRNREMAKWPYELDPRTERQRKETEYMRGEEKYRRDEERYYQDKKDKEQKDKEHAEDREYTLKQRELQKQDREDRDRRTREELRAKKNSGSNVSFVSNQDIKKMNDAIPSMINIKFYQTNDDGSVAGVATEFVLGVKAKLIPVTTEEILRRIMNDNKDGQKFLKFMRTITGELKLGDVLFGLARVKDDMKSTKRKGSYGDTWNLLANRAKAAKSQVKSGRNNDYSAITTVVISADDADELFREENFDIREPKNALHFMQSYNLMGFIIADDATEVLSIIMDDGSKTFSEYSYTMFERESKDGTYKKLINLMAVNK